MPEVTPSNLEAGPPPSTDIEILFSENQPKIMWSSRFPLARIVIEQEGERLEYSFSNYQNMLNVDIR